MVRGYRWMYRTARPAIDMSTMPDQSCIFYDIGNYPSRDHDTRKYHLSFGDACRVPPLSSCLRFSVTLPDSWYSNFFAYIDRSSYIKNRQSIVIEYLILHFAMNLWMIKRNRKTMRDIGLFSILNYILSFTEYWFKYFSN